MLVIMLFLLYLIYTKPGKEQKKIATETHEAMSPKKQPVLISQVAIDPENSEHLYAATSSSGILQSLDRGNSWKSTNQGLKTLMILDLVADPHRPGVVYASTFGGGVYRTEKAGGPWMEINEGLDNTDISKLVLNPSDSTLYAMSLTGGVYKRKDDRWTPLNSGLTLSETRSNYALVLNPVIPPILYLAGNEGILSLQEGSSWKPLHNQFKGKAVTALAYNSKMQMLIAAVLPRGLFASKDFGKNWAPLGSRSPELGPIYSISFDPSDPAIIYAGSTGKGVLKSIDGGEAWTETKEGTAKDSVSKMVVDPRDPRFLFAFPAQGGLLTSNDKGKSWTLLDSGFPDAAGIIEEFSSLTEREPVNLSGESPSGALPVPDLFKKCNGCHGWTERRLNLKSGVWKITPSRREWTPTVKRMRKMMPDLTDGEETTLIQFLNTNFGSANKVSGQLDKNGKH